MHGNTWTGILETNEGDISEKARADAVIKTHTSNGKTELPSITKATEKAKADAAKTTQTENGMTEFPNITKTDDVEKTKEE